MNITAKLLLIYSRSTKDGYVACARHLLQEVVMVGNWINFDKDPIFLRSILSTLLATTEYNGISNNKGLYINYVITFGGRGEYAKR